MLGRTDGVLDEGAARGGGARTESSFLNAAWIAPKRHSDIQGPAAGHHFCRDVLNLNMEFCSRPLWDPSPFRLRPSSPPSAADWFPASSSSSSSRPASGSWPPEKSRWARVESPEHAGIVPAGERST